LRVISARPTFSVAVRALNRQGPGSIVVFFSFTPLTNNETLYRLCAVETVADKLDHRALNHGNDFSPFRHLYINGLITPKDGGWRWDETDRRPQYRRKD